MEKLPVCRVCLNPNIRHMIKNTQLEIVYEKLTAMPFQTNDTRPLTVCYMCYAQLLSTKKFILKCLTAETLLKGILKESVETKAQVEDKAALIDRLRISSPLSVSPIVCVSTTDDDVKSEVEDNVPDIKQEMLDDQFVDAEDTDDKSELPVANQPELEQIRASGVVSCINDTKYVNVDSNIAIVAAAKLLNETNITPSVNNISKPDRQNNSDTECNNTIYLNKSSNSDLGKLVDTQERISNEIILKTTDKLCKKDYNTSSLKSNNRAHIADRPFNCNVCNKSFSKKQNFVVHMRIHTGDQPYACNKCDKRFATKSSFISHIRMHTGDRPFTCDVCYKSFINKQVLVNHTRIHIGDKPFTCNVCNKSFIYKHNLVQHTPIHSANRSFTCDVCNKSFANKRILVTHSRIHSGDKPFTCDVCNKSYIHKHNLVQHSRTHTGDKPFTCNVCNKSFAIKWSLVKHIRVHTGDQK